jgi:putative 2OG-Fe(II) oxygenase
MNSIVKNLLKKGVVKGESKILSNEEVKELEYLIIKSKDKYRKKGEVSQNIIGIDKKIDELLEKILTNPEVQNTLEKVLGENFLLRQIFVRYNEPDDQGLALHQDSLGEAGLMVLINNQPDGSTVFFPGSQLIPSEKHLAHKISWCSLKLMNIAKHFLMPAVGDAGDYYYFLHRTWHGRKPGNSNNTKISLFFDTFPVSAKRKDFLYESEYNSMINWELVTQPNLKKMISRQNYNAAVEIFEKSSVETHSLSMKVNKYNQIYKNKFYFMYIILKVIILEILFIPIRIKRFFKTA